MLDTLRLVVHGNGPLNEAIDRAEVSLEHFRAREVGQRSGNKRVWAS
jgi:hypothetical protein